MLNYLMKAISYFPHNKVICPNGLSPKAVRFFSSIQVTHEGK